MVKALRRVNSNSNFTIDIFSSTSLLQQRKKTGFLQFQAIFDEYFKNSKQTAFSKKQLAIDVNIKNVIGIIQEFLL